MFWSKYEKKKITLLLYFFASNLYLKSEMTNSDFQNLTYVYMSIGQIGMFYSPLLSILGSKNNKSLLKMAEKNKNGGEK